MIQLFSAMDLPVEWRHDIRNFFKDPSGKQGTPFREIRLDNPMPWQDIHKEAIELKGAILFCVARGNYTEGTNLKGKLCRSVIIIGVPYLNTNSPEMILQKCRCNFINLVKFLCIKLRKQVFKKSLYSTSPYTTDNQRFLFSYNFYSITLWFTYSIYT